MALLNPATFAVSFANFAVKNLAASQPHTAKDAKETAKVAKETNPSSPHTFVPVDATGRFVLMCDYTGKEVVG